MFFRRNTVLLAILSIMASTAGAGQRNLWRYTEDLSTEAYSTVIASKQTESIVKEGINLTRLTASNYYATLESRISWLELSTFVVGQYYLVSCYVWSASGHDQWPGIGLAGSYIPIGGAERKIINPGKLRRIWRLGRATSTSTLDFGEYTGAIPLGSTTGGYVYWGCVGGYPDGSSNLANQLDIYVGGFQIEQVSSDGKNGIVFIGDSTIQGASGEHESFDSLEWCAQLGARLNVQAFNRGVGGNQTSMMDARWATDMTPLAARCKYAVIQPSAANDIPNGVSFASTQASVNSMVSKAEADGFIPVMAVPAPSSAINANANYRSTYDQLVSWIRESFPRVIDIAATVSDPLNPYSLRQESGWYGDGTHFASEAKRAIAVAGAELSFWSFNTPSSYQKILAANYVGDTYRVSFSVGSHGVNMGGGSETQYVLENQAAQAPMLSAVAGWVFTGWDAAFVHVTADLTVSAQYEVETFSVWAAATGLTGNSATPWADPDVDGLPNLLEYALRTVPLAADEPAHYSSLRVQTVGGVSSLVYTHRRRKAPPLIYTYETSTNLSTWAPIAVTPVVANTDADGDDLTEIVSATIPFETGTTLFIRLAVHE